nr:hypothetical protein MarFTME_121 [Marseillevirus futianmevirus]
MEKFLKKREVCCFAISDGSVEGPNPEDWAATVVLPDATRQILPDGTEHGKQSFSNSFRNEMYFAEFGKKHGYSRVYSRTTKTTTSGSYFEGVPHGTFTVSRDGEVIANAIYKGGALVSHESFVDGEVCPLNCRLWRVNVAYPHKVTIVKKAPEKTSVLFQDMALEHSSEHFVIESCPENDEKLIRCRGAKREGLEPLRVADGFSIYTKYASLPTTKEIFAFCDKEENSHGFVCERAPEDCCVIDIR